MFAIAGGILIAIGVIWLLASGLQIMSEGDGGWGCGCAMAILAVAVAAWLIL